VRPDSVRDTDVTIHGDKERIAVRDADMEKTDIARDLGIAAWKGNTWKKSNIAKTLEPAMRNAHLAQNSPSSVPAI
jgi:hypothetical protein